MAHRLPQDHNTPRTLLGASRGDARFGLGGLVGLGGLALFMLVGLGSCASGPSPTLSLNETGSVKTSNKSPEVNCGRVIGRMQVRILQIRDYDPADKTSGLSRGLQSVVTGILGGTSAGLNPDSQHAKDIAKLREQNAWLASQGCKTFDLDKELQPQDIKHTPTAH